MASYWIVPSTEFPASQQSLDACAASGAGQILHGIPHNLEGVIPVGTLGFFEVADPEPSPEPISPEVVAAQAISDEITIRLEPAVTIPEIKSAITDGLAAAIISLGGQ